MQASENGLEISALVKELCGMLRRWSKDPAVLPIGDIDKAASTLKKLQDIRTAEDSRLAAQEEDTVMITHYIPRPEEPQDAAKEDAEQ